MIFYIAKIRLRDYIQIKSGNVMEEVPQKYPDEMKEAAAVIYRHGWGEAFAGNMSIMISEEIPVMQSERVELPCNLVNIADKVFLVTATGSRMRQITAQDTSEFCSLIKIDGNGTGYFLSGEYPKKPTSELLAHLMIHNGNEKNKNRNTTVIHCHPDSVITLLGIPEFQNADHLNDIMRDTLHEVSVILPGGAGIAGGFRPGSKELAESVSDALEGRDIVLMPGHGCFAAGSSTDEALDKIETAVKAADIIIEMIKLKIQGKK